MNKHEVTFAKLINGQAECTYGIKNYTEQDTHIRYYSIKNISDSELEEIKMATTEKVQAILSKYI